MLSTKLVTAAKISVTATTEVSLSPRLKKQLTQLLARFRQRKEEIDTLSGEQINAKDAIEEAFVEAGEYSALLAGVRVDGVPLKRVEGGTTKAFDKPGLMRRFKITPAQWDSFVTEEPKQGHLSITFKERDVDD